MGSAESPLEMFNRLMGAEEDKSAVEAQIQTLIAVIQQSEEAQTVTEVREKIVETNNELMRSHLANASVRSGGELFLRYITMTELDQPRFDDTRRVLISRGENFLSRIRQSLDRIMSMALPFINHGTRVLLHSRSKVVLALLKRAAKAQLDFQCTVTQSLPDKSGERMLADLQQAGINASLVLDAEVGVALERVDMVLLGAEAVTQSGGIVNKIGTYTVCLCAHALNVPVYVLAESCKFLRAYPLNQADLDLELRYPASAERTRTKSGGQCRSPITDYTPPQYLKLLFTDIGIVPPSAVSDELTKLYL
ncbi:hypothetical protein BOX15_Mlig004119g1 [Macrostomum lignano]|uniref:Uncharacterized protein n=2 Tax=Macrostomum lignano TaxID=282301 RepID=A0A267GMS6_9PLAT|nr:hypothetical protein BOX15_Mlig004119g1 [Macrostomum lignano]